MKTTRRVMSVVLAIAMILTTFGMVTVSAAAYSDTTGHWAESYINVWSDYGVIQGDGGYFRPDDAITRAEVAQVTQNVIGYEDAANNGFIDVSAGAWYEDAILKLAAAGTLTGNGDGTMSPDNYMTREEAMTMLARAYGLTVENSQAGITQYADYQTVSDYATGYVGAMTAAGYVGGYEDGTIRPQANISRAEFVKILDNMIKLYITAPGTYGPGYYGGIAMVKVGGVTLNGVVGNGAVISPQVSGEVSLQNCQFTGNTVNLSKNANVTSNTGINTAVQTSVPNTYYGNGPYSGSFGGGYNSGNSTSNTVTVTFYYYDDFSSYKKVSVTKGGKLSANKVPDPTELGDDNWNGLWYKSQEAAMSGVGTAFDPTSRAISTNTVLYAGREKEVVPTKAPVAPATPGPTVRPKPTAKPKPTATAKPTANPDEPDATPTNEPAAGNTISWDITNMFVDSEGNLDTAKFPQSSTNADRYNVKSDSIKNYNGLTFTTSKELDGAIQKSVKSFDDGFTSTWSLKTGGAGSDTDKVFVFTPDKAGTLKIYATSGSSGKTLPITVKQDGKTIGTVEVTAGVFEVKTVEGIEAGKEVKIVAGGNIQYYKLDFVESVEAAPTDAPKPTATLVPAATPTNDPTEYLAQIGDVTGGTIELSKEATTALSLAEGEVTLISQDFENSADVSSVSGLSISFIGEEGTGEAAAEITDQLDSGSADAADGQNSGSHGKVLKLSPYTKAAFKTGAAANGVYTYQADYYTAKNSASIVYFDIYDSTTGKHASKAVFESIDGKGRMYPAICGDFQASTMDDYISGNNGYSTKGGIYGCWYTLSTVVDAVNKTVSITLKDGAGKSQSSSKYQELTFSYEGDFTPDIIEIYSSSSNDIYVDNITLTGPKSGDPTVTPAPPTEPPATATPDPVGSIRAQAGTTIYVKGTPDNAEHVITAVTAAGATNIQKVEDNLWSFTMPAKDVTVDVTFGEQTAPEPSGTPNATAVPGLADWSFNDITAGTAYANGDTINDADGNILTIGVAEADTVLPTIKERAAGDNYLEFNDSTTEGSSKQDSWTYTADTAYEGDKVVFSADFKKSDTVKDTILFRVYDTNNTTADNSYATDGRSFELKTGDNGSLAVVDYYSADSAGKAAQVTVPGVSYSADKWFSVKAEYERNEKKVYIYAGESADTVELKATYSLGSVGEASKVTDVPVLAPTKVACFTPGGGNVVLGVDNINVESVTYQVKEVPVTGTVYTTFSDDLKNQPEAYDSSLNASVTFTKKGESTPAATAQVGSDGSYSVNLMSDATYEVEINVDSTDYTVSDLSKTDLEISKKDDKAEKNILFVHNLGDVEYKDTIEVGTEKECNTINKALSLVRKMTREAGQWVSIIVDPGTYEEQLLIDVENVEIKAADPQNKPTVQWYYGIGYLYYSADATGVYNADCAFAKTEKNTVSNWGSTIKTTKTGFRAENINFINTFNKYVTDAELEDGIVSGGKDAKNYERSNKNVNVRNSDAKERAAAIYAAGSQIELYRCSFSSSQDTFGTSTSSLYVKECDIAGNTDYICGGDNAYFENCNLLWQGYSDANKGGEITACKINVKEPNTIDDFYGYYFKNCTIGNANESGMKYPNGGSKSTGNWGRPWGNTNCKVIFDNTIIASGASKVSKWGAMSGNPMTNAAAAYVINGVYNESDLNTDLTASDDNPKGTYESNGYALPTAEDYFGGWTPKYYKADTSKIKINITAPTNGSVTAKVDDKTVSSALENDVVTVSVTPANNYEVDIVTVIKTVTSEEIILDENNSFTMPAEEVTITATFKKKSLGKYSDWNVGEQTSGSGDGAAENVTYQEVDALHITAKNAYKVVETPISTGTATFEFDIYVDTTIDRNFRVYLENTVGTYQNSENVFAEVINNRGSQVNLGPDIDSRTNPLFTYAQLGESGWVHFVITLDYSKADTDEFITITAQNGAAELGSATMGAIADKDTTLKSIRFVTTAADSYYANMQLN